MSSGHADAHKMIGLVALDCWRELVDAHALNVGGLLMIRAKLLDPQAAGLLPSAAAELLLLDVNERIAVQMGVSADLLPGSAPVEDFPPDEA